MEEGKGACGTAGDTEKLTWLNALLAEIVFRPSSPLRLPHLKFLFVCLFSGGEGRVWGECWGVMLDWAGDEADDEGLGS